MADKEGVPGDANLLPHAGLVEEVLGVPLLPSGVEYVVEPGDPPDIRTTAHAMVLRAVQKTEELHHLEPDGTGQYLGERRLARLWEHAGDVLTQVRRHVVVANNVAESVDRPAFTPEGAEAKSSPRAMLQSRIGAALYDFMQRPHPTKLPRTDVPRDLEPLRSGILVSSATATGKTVTIAALAERAGVGKPFAEVDPAINRLLLVVPSVDLLEESMDPDGTLRQWLKGRDVSAFYHKKKEAGGAVQLVVDESVPEALRSGAFDLADFPIRVVDEGDTAAAPRMMAELGKLSVGRLLMVTATPARVKRYFVSFVASTARSAAEEGITRPVQLLTYQYGPEPDAAERLAARVAARVIAIGRQVGIYCRAIRGQPDATQARRVAELINSSDILLPEGMKGKPGDYVRVIAQVSGENANAQAQADYRAGQLRGYTAIGMLGRGVNVPMDAEIIIGPRYSQDEWDQLAGRLPRPLMGRPELRTVPGLLIDLQPRDVPEGRGPLASSWRTYGMEDLDVIEQGMFIGPQEDGEDSSDLADLADLDETLAQMPETEAVPDATHPGAASAPPAESEEADTQPAHPHRGKDRRRALLDELGPDLEEHLAPPIAVREVTIAPADWDKYEKPAEGSSSLARLAAKYRVPEIWLRRQLDILSRREDLAITAEVEGEQKRVSVRITYVGVRNTEGVDAGRRWEYERWYGPATEKYLDENPPTSLPEAKSMNISAIAEMCGVSRSYIETILERFTAAGNPLSFESSLGKNGRPSPYYKLPEINRIVEEVEKTPVALPTEEALSDLAAQTSLNHVYNFVRSRRHGIVVNERRRPPESGIRGFARHVSARDADRIRDAYFNPPIATEEDISIVEMARLAGVTPGGMTKRIERIPEDRRPDVYGCKLGAKGRYADHMERAEGLAIVEQARVRRLSPDRVTLALLSSYFGKDRRSVTSRIEDLVTRGVLTPEAGRALPVNLGGQGGMVSTWRWEVMQVLEGHADMQPREGVETVDYTLVARGPYDPYWQYSQQVQERFIPRDRLVRLPRIERLRPLGPLHSVAPQSVDIDTYARERKVRIEDVFAAIADDAIPDVVLYYEDTDQPGNPRYIIDSRDVTAFDRYFQSAAKMIAQRVPPRRPSSGNRKAVTPPAAAQESAAAPPSVLPAKPASGSKQEPGTLASPEPEEPRVSLRKIGIRAGGRSIGAVNNVVRQLGLGDRLEGGRLPQTDAERVITFMAGGKKSRPASETTSDSVQESAKPATLPPAGTSMIPPPPPRLVRQASAQAARSATPRPTAEAGPAAVAAEVETPSATFEPGDEIKWKTLQEAMEELRCSPAALTHLVVSDRQYKEFMRRTEERGPELHTALLGRIRAAARRLRPTEDGWMRHGRLAQQLGLAENQLVPFLRSKGINIGERDARLARVAGGMSNVDYDVTYSQTIWKRAIAMGRRHPGTGSI